MDKGSAEGVAGHQGRSERMARAQESVASERGEEQAPRAYEALAWEGTRDFRSFGNDGELLVISFFC
jgi:hypothetical protein